MSNIMMSILGARLDHQGLGRKRWQRWRPSTSLVCFEELPISQFILIYHEEEQELAQLTSADITILSPQTEVILHRVNYENPWDFEQVYSQLLDFAEHYSFDPEQHHYYVHITTGTHVAQICLFLLTEANYIPAKLVQTSPVKKIPRGRYQIIDLDLSRYDQIASRFAREAHEGVAYLKGGIETRNVAFNQLIAQLEHVSIRSAEPILLTGATGVGKTRLAKRIYQLKKQRGQINGKLVEVNCATLRGDHAMSALFGHVKGAFTGALQARTGLLREANQGLLFLDEIGELGLDEQAMLLRALEEKVFTPFGSDKSVISHFQLIAGTNRNLFQQVQAGQFREDLLARINLWSYHLPSLRERIEDLEPNIDYELRQFTQKMQYKVSFNQAAKQAYLNFAHSQAALWRANFRDLNSSMMRMATLATGGRITEEIVVDEIQRLCQNWQAFSPESHEKIKQTPTSPTIDLADFLSTAALENLDYFDQVQLSEVINVCQQSKSLAEAGRTLFNISRTQRKTNNDSHRLRLYLQKFSLQFSDLR